MKKSNHYSYRVFWSPDDQEFVGVCAEFPSLSHLDKSQQAALAGIQGLVDFVVTDLVKSKEPIPEPLSENRYSGQLHVRIPPSLHKLLSLEAAETGRSLNSVIRDRLIAASPVGVLMPGKQRRPAIRTRKVAFPGPRKSKKSNPRPKVKARSA